MGKWDRKEKEANKGIVIQPAGYSHGQLELILLETLKDSVSMFQFFPPTSKGLGIYAPTPHLPLLGEL